MQESILHGLPALHFHPFGQEGLQDISESFALFVRQRSYPGWVSRRDVVPPTSHSFPIVGPGGPLRMLYPCNDGFSLGLVSAINPFFFHTEAPLVPIGFVVLVGKLHRS